MTKFVGLDFGTSTTQAARMRDGAPDLINMANVSLGEDPRIPWLPSVAEVENSGELVVRQASRQAIDRVIRSAKQAITRNTPFAEDGDPVEADEVVRAILSEARLRASVAEGKPLDRATVRLGCPAMWDASQRKRLLDIATAAGLKSSRGQIVDEPVAAGAGWIADEVSKGQPVNGRVLVIDYGGGTLDVAVLDVVSSPHSLESISVMSADSHPEAGDAIDEMIARDLVHRGGFKGELAARTVEGNVAHGGLRRAARELKEALSTKTSATVEVETRTGVQKISYERMAMEAAVAPLLERGLAFAFAVLRAAVLLDENAPTIDRIRDLTPKMLASGTSRSTKEGGYVPKRVDYVLLSGGTSYMQGIEHYYRDAFSSASVVRHPRPQEAVGLGLALDTTYNSMNLYRPGFDIVRIDADGTEEKLYEANDPLYTRDQVLRGEFALGLRVELKSRVGHRSQDVRIEFRDSSGKPQPLVSRSEGQPPTDGIALRIGPGSGAVMKLYVNGRLMILTPGSREIVLGVVSWPAPFGQPIGISVAELPPSLRTAGPATGETPGEPG